jgi:hypothetical protein
MSGLPALQLRDLCWIYRDDLQWIIVQVRKDGRGVQRMVSFISSTKQILLRCMREKRISPTSKAAAELECWPASFREWCESRTHQSLVGADSDLVPSV